MNCQCNIDEGTTDSGYVIKHVQGNYISLRIPFTLILAKTTNGNVTIDEFSNPINMVSVIFQKGPIKKEFKATLVINSSTIIVNDYGTLNVGSYDIIVAFTTRDGRTYRYKQNTVLQIVDSTDEGGQYETNEFDVVAYYPIIKGKNSIITITDDVVLLNEGDGFECNITDDAVQWYSRFGGSSITIDEDSVNIIIN